MFEKLSNPPQQGYASCGFGGEPGRFEKGRLSGGKRHLFTRQKVTFQIVMNNLAESA